MNEGINDSVNDTSEAETTNKGSNDMTNETIKAGRLGHWGSLEERTQMIENLKQENEKLKDWVRSQKELIAGHDKREEKWKADFAKMKDEHANYKIDDHIKEVMTHLIDERLGSLEIDAEQVVGLSDKVQEEVANLELDSGDISGLDEFVEERIDNAVEELDVDVECDGFSASVSRG
jgi:hypothetical protein